MDFKAISTVNWYPGHMRKAEREIKEKLKLIDVAVELVDARAPYSSQNGNLREAVQHKARVIVLTKSDLADPATTREWLDEFRADGYHCMSLHHHQKDAIPKLCELIIRAADEHRKAAGATTPRMRAVRAMILGLPNIGKSSLINAVIRKKRTKTGPTPGVTRHQQWVKIDRDLELLDTPGVMYPRVGDAETGLRLGLIATIKDSVVGRERLCEYLLYRWRTQDASAFLKHFEMDELPANVDVLLDGIGKRAGLLKNADEVEIPQVAMLILHAYRAGKFGRVSLETPAGIAAHQAALAEGK